MLAGLAEEGRARTARPSSTPSTRSRTCAVSSTGLYLRIRRLGRRFRAADLRADDRAERAARFGVRTGAVNDVVAWFCAAASFFAMAHAFKHGDFVRVTLLLEHLSEKARHRLEIVVLSIGSVCIAYLASGPTSSPTRASCSTRWRRACCPFPSGSRKPASPSARLLLLVAVVDELVLVLRGNKPSYVAAVEERHAKGDFSADV
jgi:TRAP-type C4-dicarboxylate transport system permease small subunit